MATLKERREAMAKRAAELVGKSRNGEELTSDEVQEMAKLKSDSEALLDQIKAAEDAEALVKSLGTPEEARTEEVKRTEERGAKSLGEHFVKGMGERGVLARFKGGNRVAQVDLPEFGAKAATDVHLTSTAPGTAEHMFQPDIDRNIVRVYDQRPTIADWLGAGTIALNAITYFIEKVWDDGANGQFATVAEGARKPQLHAPDYEEITEVLKKIAGFIKLSTEMAEDQDFLVSEINNRLLFQLLLTEEDQLLNGDGVGTNVKGLLNREGVQVQTSETEAANLDSIYKAINSVFTKTGLRADAVIINPADYEKIRLAKDANGQYYAGGPFTGQYGVGGVLVDPPLWGLQTIQTTAVPAGTVLVGAGKQGATVYRKGGIRVETSNIDGEDFTHNRFTILAEERLTLAVRKPDAFVKLTLASAAA